MQQRSLQIVLKRLSVEELKSHGIITQHNGMKTIVANENRKRKRICIDDIGNGSDVRDFVGRITRSKSQKKPDNSSSNTVSSSKLQSTVDSPINRNRKRKRTEKSQRSNAVNDSIGKRCSSRIAEKISVSNQNHKIDAVDAVEKQKTNANGLSKRKKQQVGVKNNEKNRNEKPNDEKEDVKVVSDPTIKQTRSKTRNTGVHLIDSKKETTMDLSSKHKTNSTQKTQTRTSETENRKRKRTYTKMQLQEYIDNESPNRQYIVNEIILATIPGFAPWPARILKIIGQTITVEFFGTGHMYALIFVDMLKLLLSYNLNHPFSSFPEI